MNAKTKLTNMLVFHIIFRNRQTLSGKLSLHNYIRNLCRQLWQKFTPYKKLQQMVAEFLLRCNSLTIGARNIRVHPRFFRNRQTLSAKLGLPNNIGHLCHQLWQKFTRHEKLANVNALRSELLFSVICFGAAHHKVRKYRKAQQHFGTRMTRIARIFTDTSYPRLSAQSAFHHVCSSLKNPASGASISAFISVNQWFVKTVIFQTGLTGSTGYVFNPVILSNSKCQPSAPEIAQQRT